MRVAYLVPPLGKPSGYRTYVCGFLSAISEYVKPILFVEAGDDETAKTLFPKYKVIALPAIQKASFKFARTWPRLLASWWTVFSRDYPDVDLVHSLEAYPTGLVGNWLSSKLARPHVLAAVGTYSVCWHATFFDRLAYKHVLRKTSVLCPISNGTANLVGKYFADTIADVWVRPILVGNDYFKSISRSEVVWRQLPFIPTILSVGAIKPRKGYHVSLRAFARLKEDIPSARYWIVGGVDRDEYYRELLQFIEANRLQDVQFLGVVSEDRLKQCYREASVFLLSPQQVGLAFEGFGLVYLEAGAYGLPVVGTRTGGVPDAVRDGETGFLLDPDDVNGLADALKLLLTNARLARRMGLANRKWAESLTWERYAQEHYGVYQKVVSDYRT